MERNTALAEETLQYIKDHPFEWMQSTYGMNTQCGTVGCFAYHAVNLSGEYEHVLNTQWHKRGSLSHTITASKEAAMQVLGLTEDEALTMFTSYNTLDELSYMVKDFVNGDEVRER